MVILVGYVQMAEERQLKALVIRIYNYDNMLVEWNQNRLRYLCFAYHIKTIHAWYCILYNYWVKLRIMTSYFLCYGVITYLMHIFIL